MAYFHFIKHGVKGDGQLCGLGGGGWGGEGEGRLHCPNSGLHTDICAGKKYGMLRQIPKLNRNALCMNSC